MATNALWFEYTTNGSAIVRDKLLNEHLGLVHHVARQLSKTLSNEVDFDELVSCGVIGLVDALDSFDPSRGIAYSTFAIPRIRGAILDALRKQDHVPRSVRKKSRDIREAREALTARFGSAPSEYVVAEYLAVEPDTLSSWLKDIECISHVPMDAPISSSEKNAPTPAEMLASEVESSIEDELIFEEEVGSMRMAMMELKEQERVVLSLYYFEELKLNEIAKILELTESRISQIRSKAIQKLRVRMQPLRAAA